MVILLEGRHISNNMVIMKLWTIPIPQKRGHIEEDYYVWWEYEDQILYNIVREELLRIVEQEDPYAGYKASYIHYIGYVSYGLSDMGLKFQEID